jgi:DNA-binding PadR family transcriptional regulator
MMQLSRMLTGTMAKKRPTSSDDLTLADLTALAKLAERPTHGYELATELKASGDGPRMSKAQTYYSLKKLLGLGYITSIPNNGDSAGPGREPYKLSPAGKKAMTLALSRPEWARERPSIPFHTWLILVAQGEASDRASVLRERRKFLDEQIRQQTVGLAASKRSALGAAIARAMGEHAVQVYKLERQLLDAIEPMLGVSQGCDGK